MKKNIKWVSVLPEKNREILEIFHKYFTKIFTPKFFMKFYITIGKTHVQHFIK